MLVIDAKDDLSFEYVEKWPEGDIDHIDGDSLNNRIKNLRDATRSENMGNARKSKASTTGVTGVSFNVKAKKYEAYIHSNGKNVYLGLFDTTEEAAAARQAANERFRITGCGEGNVPFQFNEVPHSG